MNCSYRRLLVTDVVSHRHGSGTTRPLDPDPGHLSVALVDMTSTGSNAMPQPHSRRQCHASGAFGNGSQSGAKSYHFHYSSTTSWHGATSHSVSKPIQHFCNRHVRRPLHQLPPLATNDRRSFRDSYHRTSTTPHNHTADTNLNVMSPTITGLADTTSPTSTRPLNLAASDQQRPAHQAPNNPKKTI